MSLLVVGLNVGVYLRCSSHRCSEVVSLLLLTFIKGFVVGGIMNIYPK